MKSKPLILILMAIVLSLALLSACVPTAAVEEGDGLSIVSTIFPSYDFARQITADTDARVTLLLQPGEEVHSFDPTSQDIIRIQNADLFLFVGGENDVWVDGVLSGLDKSVNTFRMMDYVTLYEEELVAGMQEEPEEADAANVDANEQEWDEHVWTAPVNAIAIVKAMTAELISLDPDNASTFQTNADAYVKQLEALDQSFREVVNASGRKTIVFADRFPVRYFVEEFGLNYYAAFPGCSAETDASAATVASLIDRVKADNIPVVFYIEMSNEQMANTVAEATGAMPLLFHSTHNVTKAEFEGGATYLSLMQNNVIALLAALN
ncbi:MAG: zinc ABC transporter substrate-binding protein [Firmicutes bacterium HGW-Firmicutes-9]|jgi:zinc transport system substrate-binding protein|nr:MAG: zinc ABC transporter substrate-binding protein [Firmicutes bacterium HGW-Firmicutes-9]